MILEALKASSFPEALTEEWEALLLGSHYPNPFLTPAWNEIWLRHFGSLLEVKIILCRTDLGPLLALGAFVNSKGEGNGLTLLGSTDVCDYRDLIVAPGSEEQVFKALAGFFREGPWEYLEFDGISEFSPTAQFLPPVMESFGFKVVKEVEEAAIYLDLPSNWEDFLERLNAKDRHELRRKMRRIEREATFELSGNEDLPSGPEKMEIFFSLNRKSRKDKAEFMTPAMESYFREIASRFKERGWLKLSFLKVEGQEVAAFFSFDFAGTEYVYNSGYDPQFSRFSPGIILAALCIRRAIEKGMIRFNFLRGREEYKYRLGGKEEKIYRIRVEKR
ncbi:MAG: GNAT family N-acetyltransferase [Deltaproteobacteria bacterium]|nr:GNAT family N-acetyltransferase [Deltaproteobacteria bacterium]